MWPMLKITCTCHGISTYIENNYHREQGFALLPHILLLLSNVKKVLLVLFNLLSMYGGIRELVFFYCDMPHEDT